MISYGYVTFKKHRISYLSQDGEYDCKARTMGEVNNTYETDLNLLTPETNPYVKDFISMKPKNSDKRFKYRYHGGLACCYVRLQYIY
jgi:hypothetical protein